MNEASDIFGMQISHVRAVLGFVCREVARSGRPLGIRRYCVMDVAIVPLAEWRRLVRLEAELAMAEATPQPGGQGA